MDNIKPYTIIKTIRKTRVTNMLDCCEVLSRGNVTVMAQIFFNINKASLFNLIRLGILVDLSWDEVGWNIPERFLDARRSQGHL